MARAEHTRRTPDTLAWNTWAEPTFFRSYKPAALLNVESDYRVTVHLSALPYLPAGVTSRPTGARFRDLADEWLRAGERKVKLKIVMLHDPARFETPGRPVQEIEVDLDRVRNLPADALTVADPFEVLRQDPNPPFVFGGAEFEVTTRAVEGPAALSFSVWANNRPIEEFFATFCVGRSAAVADQQCQNAPPLVYALKGVDSLRLAAQKAPTPDAALHFVEGSRRVNFEIVSLLAAGALREARVASGATGETLALLEQAAKQATSIRFIDFLPRILGALKATCSPADWRRRGTLPSAAPADARRGAAGDGRDGRRREVTA